jgi:hypothetical protein
MLPVEDRPYKLPTQQNARHCQLQVKFTLEEAVKAQRGRRSIALLFL